MNRLREELRTVPPAARVLAIVVYLGAAATIGTILWPKVIESHPLAHLGYALLVGAAPILPALYVLLIGYIYGDAKRRGMRSVLWTLLAIFIPNAIGVILYFVLREPILMTCPSCGFAAKPGYAFCPRCGAALARACPACRRAVEPDWANCAYCGADLRSPTTHAA